MKIEQIGLEQYVRFGVSNSIFFAKYLERSERVKKVLTPVPAVIG
jgi:hypothetical protein